MEKKYNLERVLLTSVVASFQEAGGKKQQALFFASLNQFENYLSKRIFLEHSKY